MKATYQKPTTDVVLVMAQTILAGSLGNGEDPSPFDPSKAGNTDDLPSGWTPGSRRGSLWDDDEE